jgi:hypothetical protein
MAAGNSHSHRGGGTKLMPALGRMVVRKGGGNAEQTQQNVVVLEWRKSAPPAMALIIEPQPVEARIEDGAVSLYPEERQPRGVV